MQLLPLVQQFCARMGLASPSAVAGSTDRMITQIQALMNEVLEELTRWKWQQVTVEAVFTTVATESQGTIDSIAPQGFEKIKGETFFNRTQRLRVLGPLSGEEWQATKALTFSAPNYYWRLQGGLLKLTPTPAAGETLAFEYMSKALVYNAADDEYKTTFTKDTDEFLLDSRLMSLGIRWMWKKEKGLPYAEELRSFEQLAAQLAGSSDGGRDLQMGGIAAPVPGIIVPSGNWNLP